MQCCSALSVQTFPNKMERVEATAPKLSLLHVALLTFGAFHTTNRSPVVMAWTRFPSRCCSRSSPGPPVQWPV